MNEKEISILRNRLLELSERSLGRNCFCFTDFLGLAEQSVFHSMSKELKGTKTSSFGGAESCERVIIRFGDPYELGYEEPFPIDILEIRPLDSRSETLPFTHRDILGACMNLGINRATMGDIFIKEDAAYLFCLETMSSHIKDELYKVKHTHVSVEHYKGDISFISPILTDVDIRVTGERLDSVISRLYNLSRDEGQKLFGKGLVFINGKECKTPHVSPPENAVISVRGLGRFIYKGTVGSTKKDKLIIKVQKY